MECKFCKNKGYIEIIEWSGTDESCEKIIKCKCNED